MAFSYKSIFGSFRDDLLTTFYVLVHVRGWPSSLGPFLRALGNILGFGLDFFIENLRFTTISTTWIFLIVFVYFFFPRRPSLLISRTSRILFSDTVGSREYHRGSSLSKNSELSMYRRRNETKNRLRVLRVNTTIYHWDLISGWARKRD